jgi:hypothetical protein
MARTCVLMASYWGPRNNHMGTEHGTTRYSPSASWLAQHRLRRKRSVRPHGVHLTIQLFSSQRAGLASLKIMLMR